MLGQHGGYFINLLFVFGLGLVALTLFINQTSHREYLWIFLQFVARALAAIVFGPYNNLSERWLVIEYLAQGAVVVFITLMYYAFMGQRLGLWLKVLLTLSLISFAGVEFGGNSVPRIYNEMAQTPLYVVVFTAQLAVLIVHRRKGNREAGLLLIPATMWALANFAAVILSYLDLIPSVRSGADHIYNFLFGSQIGPFTISLRDICQVMYLSSLTIIIVARSTRISREQAFFEGELEAAREVQQVILPKQVESIPGFTIEALYEPVQQVGGDFFQILPTAEGGLLVVIGDVAGKGLPAAMLVSVLVGAIRTAAVYTQFPEEILFQLNERLVGRAEGGFSTALAVRITAEGWVTIANAGHLSPYLDGREVELAGALPLGIISGTTYASSRFRFLEGSRLTFYTDGVIEAQNENSELFGFDRAGAISTQPAADIVKAATDFGQQDDITVITIERVAAGEEGSIRGVAPILAPA